MPRRRIYERDVKLRIGKWLEAQGCLIYNERKNKEEPTWGVFRVKGVQRTNKPDLLIRPTVEQFKGKFIALEIKVGHSHSDLLDGFDSVLRYFSDYAFWGAQYSVGGSLIEIAAFALATNCSPDGYLYVDEGKFSYEVKAGGGWLAHPCTYTFARLLWRQRDNLLKRMHELVTVPGVEMGKRFSLQVEPPHVGVLVNHPKHGRPILMASDISYWEIGKLENKS